jgi:hypothetical protein
VSYPIPFLFAGLLIFSLITFAEASRLPAAMQRLLVGVGGTTWVFALVIVGYAVFSKPELLRSERHVVATTLLSILGDSAPTGDQVVEMARLLDSPIVRMPVHGTGGEKEVRNG